MFKVTLHHKKEGDEQQKNDQHAVTAFVMLAVERFVFSVNKDGCDCKSNQKQD